jgi:hypothetical protein
MADDSTNSAPNDLSGAIATNAGGPAKASADGTSVEQHSLRDQIEADKYLAAKNAMTQRNFGLRRARIVPPGATEGY